jgi:hypothetical protein
LIGEWIVAEVGTSQTVPTREVALCDVGPRGWRAGGRTENLQPLGADNLVYEVLALEAQKVRPLCRAACQDEPVHRVVLTGSVVARRRLA